MNSQDVLNQIMQDRSDNASRSAGMEQESKKEDSQDIMLGTIADFLDAHAEILTKNTQGVRVLNHPKEIKVSGAVSMQEADLLMASFDDLEQALCASISELKDSVTGAINSDKSVTVTNHPEQKEVLIPDKVQANILTMPKYVSDGFDKLYKAIRALDLKVNVDAPQVSVAAPDLSALVPRLTALETLLQSILEKEIVEFEQPDFTPVNDILGRIEETMKSVENNTGVQTSQTFRNSWDKSFDMKSKDMTTAFHYTTLTSGRKVTDYIDVTDDQGDTYRRTFTFDSDGDVATATKWTKQ